MNNDTQLPEFNDGGQREHKTMEELVINEATMRRIAGAIFEASLAVAAKTVGAKDAEGRYLESAAIVACAPKGHWDGGWELELPKIFGPTMGYYNETGVAVVSFGEIAKEASDKNHVPFAYVHTHPPGLGYLCSPSDVNYWLGLRQEEIMSKNRAKFTVARGGINARPMLITILPILDSNFGLTSMRFTVLAQTGKHVDESKLETTASSWGVTGGSSRLLQAIGTVDNGIVESPSGFSFRTFDLTAGNKLIIKQNIEYHLASGFLFKNIPDSLTIRME